MYKIRIKIKDILNERNITQKQLESMSGVHQARISKLLREDRQEVNLIMLEKIAAALNITDISELMQFVEVLDPASDPDSP